ncbi:MAG: amidohydrolase family protein [Bacteroidota bacterium]
MKTLKIILSLIVILLIQCKQAPENRKNLILIKGGTIINTEWNGSEVNDIENSFILIEKGKIKRVGKLTDTTTLAGNTQIIDAAGKYIVPGLIDGFAVINNQAYANAFLLSGVTSIIGVESTRRGDLFEKADPSPEIFKLGEVGDTIQTKKEISQAFENWATKKVKVMLLMYKLTPELLQFSLNLADKYQMATIGELGFTSYKEGVDMGTQAFVHTTRYSLDIASKEMANAVAKEPFSNELNSPKWKYYQFLYSLNVEDSSVINHAINLGKGNSYLMPTLSLLYLDFPEHKNPWDEAVAKFINTDDINNPANKETGNHDYTEEVQKNYTKMALKEIELEQKYYQHGAKYIAGSACDVWGTMPGISLHTELELLKKIGLSNRQLIAATTSNFNKAFGWEKGKIEEGFDADILILNENPLENIENLKKINALILKGKLIDLKSLMKNKNE